MSPIAGARVASPPPIFEEDCRLRRVNGLWVQEGWTDKGVREVKWPKDFTKAERSLIRAIAAVALESSKKVAKIFWRFVRDINGRTEKVAKSSKHAARFKTRRA